MAHDFDEFAPFASAAPAPAAATPGAPGVTHDLDEFADYAKPPKDTRGFFTRAKDSIVSGAKAVGHVGGELLEHPIDTITDPAKRHEFERGVSDVVTLGYGTKLAARVGNALGDVGRGTSLNEQLHFEPNSSGHRMAGRGAGATSEVEAREAAAAPQYRTAGNVVGSVIPNLPGKVIGRIGGKVLSPITESLTLKGAGLVTEQALARVPWLGKVLAPAVPVAGAAAKSVAGYEGTAPLTAALSAGAEGHRLEAAKDAATDPGGLVLSAAAGAAPVVASRALKGAAEYSKAASKNADEWLVNDVVGEKRGESTPTARKQLASDGDDVKSLLKEDPQLRDVVGHARHSDKKVLSDASDIVRSRLQDVSEPHQLLYRQADEAIGGGARSGDVVEQFRAAAREQAKDGTASGEAKARELTKQADRLEAATDWGGRSKIYDPDKPIGDQGTVGQAVEAIENVAKRATDPAHRQQLEEEIANLKASATTIGYNPDHVVGLAKLRKVVSDVQSSAYDGMGGLTSTKAHGLSVEVATDAKKILTGYLDEAKKKAPQTVEQIKEMNWRVSALKNVQKVIDQRLDNATLNATGVGTPAGGVRAAVSHLAHSSVPLAAAELALHGHPVIAAAGTAAILAPKVKRFVDTKVAANAAVIDRAVARLARAVRAGEPVADAVSRAVAAGVGAEAARRIAAKYAR